MASRTLEVVIVGNASQLTQTLGKANQQVQGFGDKMAATGKKMRNVGHTLTTHLTLPIVAVGAASTKMALDFETSMNHVQTLTGASAKQTKQWGDQILEMGKTLPIGPQELAKALYFVASSGVKVSQVMPILRKSAEAAAAGMGDTQTVAQLLTSAINAYGGKALTAAHATDVLTTAVKIGKAEPLDLAANLGKVLPVASAMHVKFGELAASVSELTNTGLDAAEATTAVRATLSGLLKPASGAAKELDILGFSVKGVQDMISKKGLNFTLDLLAKRLGGNREEMGKLFPNIRALTGFLALTGKNAGNVKLALDKMNHSAGATDKAFKSASQSADFKLRKSLAQLQDTAIKVGEVLIPIFERVAAKVASLADWFSGLSKTEQNLILITGGVLAALGPVLTITGNLITMILALRKATLIYTAAQWLLNIALDANPIGAVIIAAGVLATAFVILWKRSGTFRDVVRGAIHDVTVAFQIATGFIRQHWQTMLAVITGGASTAVLFVIHHFNTIKTAIGSVVGFIRDRWGNLKTIWSAFAGWVDKYIIGPIKAIIRWAKRAISLLESIATLGYSGKGGTPASGGRGMAPGTTPSSANQRLGQQMMTRAGFASNQWGALQSLWTQESGWSNTAYNASSGATGIPQALPYSKMPRAAWLPSQGGSASPSAQIGWGLGYIRGRYGSPAGAWAHEQRFNWYDKGGVVPGRGAQMAVVHGGETILPTHRRGYGPTIIVQIEGIITGTESQVERLVRKAVNGALRHQGPNAFQTATGLRP